jgi:hypothetical protein
LARKNELKGPKELGYITLLMLILFATFSAYGLEMYVKAHSESIIARREVSSRQVVYAAESGIEWVKVKLKEDPSFLGGEISLGEGIVQVNVTPQEEGYRVISFAQVGQIQRRLEVVLEGLDGKWIITMYREIHGDG